MLDYKTVLKVITRKEPLKKGDKILAGLDGTKTQEQWNEVLDLSCQAAKMLREFELLTARLDAKRVLFWQELANISEQAETAEDRGKLLGLRYTKEGKLVLVEFDDKPPQIPPFLQAFLGFSGEDSNG